MKTTIILCLLVLSLGIFSARQYIESQSLQARALRLDEIQPQLLSQVEANTTQRLNFEQQISSLERDLSFATNQIHALSLALQEARENANPDIEAIREQARQDLEEDLKNDPLAVARLMMGNRSLEQQQSSARSLVAMSYNEFLSQLDIDEDRENRIRELLTSLQMEQNQAARDRADGDIDTSTFTEIFSTQYMLNQLASLLTEEEQEIFSEYREILPQRQERKRYSSQVVMMAPSLTESNREFLLDSMMDNMSVYGENLRSVSTASSYFDRQLEGIERVRENISEQFSEAQLRAAKYFLDQQQSTMETARVTSESQNSQSN